MEIEGGCYCKKLRYRASGEPLFRAQCHCRECQYITGGSPNVILGMPADGFAYTRGAARGFARSDLPAPVTREFCPDCGTHLLTRAPGMPTAVFLKVGGFDDPSLFGGPQMVVYAAERQSFHQLPEGIPIFERGPR